MNTAESDISVTRGLSLFHQLENPRYFRKASDCIKYRMVHFNYPFDIADTPPTNNHDVLFLGATATDMSIEVFVAHVLGELEWGSRPTMLRIVSMPAEHGTPGHNMVFFEMWTRNTVLISGETTDFSGAGKYGKWSLESFFDVVSREHKVEIRKVQCPRIRIQYLYNPRNERK